MKLIDGKHIAATILDEITEEVAKLGDEKPAVTFVRVGEDPASVSYVRNKERAAAKTGIRSELKVFPETISENELLAEIKALNENPSIHGILVQAPLPDHIDEGTIFRSVLPEKDVDGFHTVNIGKLCQEDPSGSVACTPAGVIELLKRSDISTEGKHVVVLGRSLIVGKPVSLLFLQKGAFGNATVTVCHSRTRDIASIVKQADIVVAAIGRAHFVTADMLKPGAVVIDVGINRIEDSSRKSGYRLVGDVDFEAAKDIVSAITPVPGGVGPMTVAMLMKNTLRAFQATRS
ncbi:MAG: bifunctional methylenetetrahydrofolate dehydrogenase/methenyltetrahydrofolate cyclohydrolase FolD [Verrucomicrobia bacterium]|nr:bifunctional methylenetetrahydrofolate dehydrogenase/methenyltetrahydrofolate cyclohydrolase FolD [Verrucomicrobiota bacterium]MDA1066442.1 bifunctional methylenetetrahydrofolate dehydrogenase/methenyltetrahydrofolate cyclohydrolase FolD [Verrucomicrobiota bacterium]